MYFYLINNDIIVNNYYIIKTYGEKQLMLKLTLLDCFARGLPEALLFIFAAYVFSKNELNLRRYLVSSVLFVVLGYFIRLLPIQYGLNTILSFIGLIILIIKINKIDIVNAVTSGIAITILELICEGINVFIIQYIFKADINFIFNDSTLKILYGIPSLLIFGCIIAIYYFRLLKRKELKPFTNGEVKQ